MTGPEESRRLSRRQFLEQMAAATLAAMAAGEPRLVTADEAGEPIQHPEPKADACILLWMAGGMAAPETFDPKRYAPFEVGLPAEKIMSTFPAIDTVVDHIKISQGLENIARIMDRATLIRSHVQPDLGHILHSRHQYHWHTGYVPPQTVAAPHLGAWIAKVLGPRNPAIPAFIDIGQRLEGLGEKEELKAFHTAGFFGSEYGPFLLPYPDQAIEAVRPPKGMTRERFQARYRRYREMVRRSPLGELGSDYQQESMLRAMENADRLLNSPERKAFDLSLEPKESYEAYNTGRFGLGCLLARRLVEAGARFIEVTTEYEPFKSWDTHENGHTTAKRMKEVIDRPIARLILDLEQRGLLDRTLVILASEFSRDMLIEGVPGSTARDQSRAKSDVMKEMIHYGLHRHFTGASSVLLFGGGMKKGFLYGESAPERPCIATKNPVSVTDLHATILTALGISPKTAFIVEKRPFHVTEDGKGQPVMDLFA
ncbi:MAG: DUF1501 domain-containing protein [Isosphaeraceae bacterium]|nr:DUF1501 domain-containing protein [Isosphaeraceae bacterium]